MEEDYNEVAERVGVHQATQQSNLVASQNQQLQYQMEEVEKNLAEAQLDCEETLTKIYHLLKQDILKPKWAWNFRMENHCRCKEKIGKKKSKNSSNWKTKIIK